MNLLTTIFSYFKKATPKSNGNTWTAREIDEFKQNLRQVIPWTEQLAANFDFENGKYGLVFRQTNPALNGNNLYRFDGDYTTWAVDDYSYDNYDLLLQSALDQRPDAVPYNWETMDAAGRILCFQTCTTTHDGAPIAESKHFIDESDVPPIDTWFFLKRDYYHSDYQCPQSLFCWIPRAFEAVVQQAIDVEILDSYRWLDENDPSLYHRIKNGK